jgi:hypothetical protein
VVRVVLRGRHWLKLRNGKYVMNLPVIRKLDSVGQAVDTFCDLARTDILIMNLGVRR